MKLILILSLCLCLSLYPTEANLLTGGVVMSSERVFGDRVGTEAQKVALLQEVSKMRSQVSTQLGPFNGLINGMIFVMNDDYPYMCKCNPEGMCSQVSGLALTQVLQRCDNVMNGSPTLNSITGLFIMVLCSIVITLLQQHE
eukprot:Filipodium_phascolosomae@DN3640_c0_g1_i1.p1